jgi:2-polyprenyl-6-methoxyphenol hydroxylase-like FAD-dependent oxidoreductase
MRIAIIGGGIGGLSAALALRQFGFEPDVYEQAPELLEVGAAIAVWPNAMRILQRLGIAELVMQHAGVIEQVRWLKQDGRTLNQLHFQKADAPAVALHRADLQSALLNALPQKSIHLGHVFAGYRKEENGINASFANGSAIDCELLIGADGLHSRVRAQLVNDGEPIFRGYMTWRGIASSVPRAVMPGTAVEIHGRGKRFGIGPVGQAKIGWWATAKRTGGRAQVVTGTQEAGDTGTGAMQSRGDNSDATRRQLLKLFDGWCDPVLELIQATPSIITTPVVDRPSIRSWGTNCITMLGDAAHPTTPNLGQGGCLAIEDAIVLARTLEKYCQRGRDLAPSNLASALRQYEQLRYMRTAAITTYSRLYGAIGQWESAAAAGLRDTTLSLLPQIVIRRSLEMVLGYDAFLVKV